MCQTPGGLCKLTLHEIDIMSHNILNAYSSWHTFTSSLDLVVANRVLFHPAKVDHVHRSGVNRCRFDSLDIDDWEVHFPHESL